jgi:nucleotide-binding universal stress UspA family protein
MLFRIRSILVATDLSDGAAAVLRGAGALAELAEAELHVVSAVDPYAARMEEVTLEEAKAAATSAVKEQLRASLPPRIPVTTCRVTAGAPHEVILQRSRDLGVDLVVIGPHRERPEGNGELGTTADRLIRTSDAPCLVLRAPLSLPLRRMLVSSDLSAAAGGAVNLALVWAGALRLPSSAGERTRLDVVHVAAPTRGGDRAGNREEDERELREQVADAVRSSGVRTLVAIEPVVLEGEQVADEILRVARESASDLLVMGTHGRSSTARALIGRVSSVVARRAGCPVLLVPPDFWRDYLARESAAGGRS